MSYKIGLLLSMIFVALFFLFGADLISLQSAYSSLEAKANNISYLISRNGVIDNDFINYVESTFYVDFECATNLNPTFGEKIIYTIKTEYHPLVISHEEMTLYIKCMFLIKYLMNGKMVNVYRMLGLMQSQKHVRC